MARESNGHSDEARIRTKYRTANAASAPTCPMTTDGSAASGGVWLRAKNDRADTDIATATAETLNRYRVADRSLRTSLRRKHCRVNAHYHSTRGGTEHQRRRERKDVGD